TGITAKLLATLASILRVSAPWDYLRCRHKGGQVMARERKAPGVSAVQFLPERVSMSSLREAVQTCRGCSLYQNATQAVFGEGQRSARVVLVGEQPGNDEDRQGRPFVGPAGRVLDQALESAGIDRADAYVTNVVKHFGFVLRGKRRIHKKPTARQIAA